MICIVSRFVSVSLKLTISNSCRCWLSISVLGSVIVVIQSRDFREFQRTSLWKSSNILSKRSFLNQRLFIHLSLGKFNQLSKTYSIRKGSGGGVWHWLFRPPWSDISLFSGLPCSDFFPLTQYKNRPVRPPCSDIETIFRPPCSIFKNAHRTPLYLFKWNSPNSNIIYRDRVCTIRVPNRLSHDLFH